MSGNFLAYLRHAKQALSQLIRASVAVERLHTSILITMTGGLVGGIAGSLISLIFASLPITMASICGLMLGMLLALLALRGRGALGDARNQQRILEMHRTTLELIKNLPSDTPKHVRDQYWEALAQVGANLKGHTSSLQIDPETQILDAPLNLPAPSSGAAHISLEQIK